MDYNTYKTLFKKAEEFCLLDVSSILLTIAHRSSQITNSYSFQNLQTELGPERYEVFEYNYKEISCLYFDHKSMLDGVEIHLKKGLWKKYEKWEQFILFLKSYIEIKGKINDRYKIVMHLFENFSLQGFEEE